MTEDTDKLDIVASINDMSEYFVFGYAIDPTEGILPFVINDMMRAASVPTALTSRMKFLLPLTLSDESALTPVSGNAVKPMIVLRGGAD